MSFNIALSGIYPLKKIWMSRTTWRTFVRLALKVARRVRRRLCQQYFRGSDQQTGNGSATASVAQQFSQGTLNFTQNSLIWR